MTANKAMKDFYDRVIEDFGSRLYNKFNNKEQGFDTERIDQIKMVHPPLFSCSSRK